MTTLQQHLDRCYAQAIGHQHPSLDKGVSAKHEFHASLAADQELRTAAQERQKSLVAAVTQKCYISRTHKAVLDSLLGA